MLREYPYVWRSMFIVIDLGISAFAFVGAYWLRFSAPLVDTIPTAHVPPIAAYYEVIPAVFVCLWITNNYFKLYHPRRISSFLDELLDIVKSNGLAVLLLMTFFFFNRSFSYARSVVVIFAFLNPLGISLFRMSVRGALRFLRARGYNLRRIIIVGTGQSAQALIHRLQRNPWTGMRIRGLLSCKDEMVGRKIHGIPVLGTVDAIDGLMRREPVDQVYIALPATRRRLIERLANHLSRQLIAVRLVPDIGWFFDHRQLADFEGLPVFSVLENRLRGWNAFSKRVMDFVLATVAIICCLPLFLVIAALVKLTSRGPIFYLQKRMGLDGRIFPILKFRTMRADAEERPSWTEPHDGRCTGFGSILRRTSLDELPQLFNVLLGQMSLVGPRPERPALIEQFRETLPRYMLRHQFKAGITGWAQVNGWRGNTSLRKRLQYDLYYLQHWSIWFDVKILALTLVRGLIHRNAY